MDEPTLLAVHAIKLSDVLRVRVRWLVENRGTMVLPPEAARANAILAHMSPEQTEGWLELGERLVEIGD